MAIYGFWGYDDTCKTLNAVEFVFQLVRDREYDNVYSNIRLYGLPVEYKWLSTSEVRSHMAELIPKEIKNTLYLIDEADVVFPADDYLKQEMKEAMTFTFQTYKLHTDVIYVAHRGKGVNLKLRLATHYLMVCYKSFDGRFFMNTDYIHKFGTEHPVMFERINPELTYGKYNRWEVIKP